MIKIKYDLPFTVPLILFPPTIRVLVSHLFRSFLVIGIYIRPLNMKYYCYEPPMRSESFICNILLPISQDLYFPEVYCQGQLCTIQYSCILLLTPLSPGALARCCRCRRYPYFIKIDVNARAFYYVGGIFFMYMTLTVNYKAINIANIYSYFRKAHFAFSCLAFVCVRKYLIF